MWDETKLISAFRLILFEYSPILHEHPELENDFKYFDCIEASRIMVKKEHRGRKCFKQFLKFLADECVALEVDYMLGVILTELLPLYKYYGVNILGEPYYDPTVDGVSELPNCCIAINEPLMLQKFLHGK